VTSHIEEMPEELQKHREQLEGRSILVKKAKVIPIEAIVRGYITGEQQHSNAGRAFRYPIYAVFL
jgi:phosphoribosylaminoimidazole-succinocarboxamide synthase